MKRAISLNLFLASIAGMMLCVPAAEAKDRGNNGNGSVEFSIPLNYTETSTVDGSNGSSATVDAALNSGFGIAYNINDNFQINGTFSWANRNYTVTGFGNGTLSTSSLQMNAVWYFMPGDFTPFVSAGFGSTFIDTNIPNGSGSGTCYWDPYWGYVCGTYYPTKSSTNISYGGGLGARYDFNRQFALQGSLNRMYIDNSQVSGGKPTFDMFRVDFIFRM
ncbi:MAG TPA: outer membrane beta-barrel protein [Gallionella sp.]|nr:outer membrane beta-barrel protein [Gallionella sp.]